MAPSTFQATIGVTLIVLLAGCAAPAAPRDDVGAPPIASAAVVDLHEYVLNITMPEGQPTMLVALNVTKDMWVRPWAEAEDHAARDPTFWVLCPSVRSLGLGEGNGFAKIPFWLDGTALRPATENQDGMDRGTDGPGACASQLERQNRGATVRADEPRDGTLVLLLAATNQTFGEAPDPAPPLHDFRFLVGVARDTCDGGKSLCPPQGEVAAEPIARAGQRFDADHASLWSPCDGCGFELRDDSMTVPVPLDEVGFGDRVSVGKLTASRTGGGGHGLVIARVSVLGQAAVDARLEDQGGATSFHCESDADGSFWLIRYRDTGDFKFEASLDMKATNYWRLHVKEIPIDLDVLGWTFEPVALLKTNTSPQTGTTVGPCS